LTKKVHDLVIAEPGVTQIKRLTVRKSGSVYFASIELGIAEANIVEAHKQIDRLVEKLHKAIVELESVTIHYEPDHPPYQTTVELLDADRKTLSRRFGTTPWLHIIKRNPDGSLISDTLIENTSKDAPRGKAFLLAAWLISQHADTVIMGQADLDENIIALFRSLGMTLRQVQSEQALQ
ncbi:MAG TPA: cation transporter, partial [Gammaproteobacteria bacterium]|nr:cation transporter [Gammaproteobacteria bacterium]